MIRDNNLQEKPQNSKFEAKIPEMESIQKLIQYLPYYALIMDGERQIIYSNDKFLNDHSVQEMSFFSGKGPGDIFQCENALEKGCGYSDHCIYCGIHKTLSECRLQKRLITNRCNLTIKKNGGISSYEFLASCSPLVFNGSEFYLLTLVDISADNRRRMMERVFYHDIVNFLSSLQGLSEILILSNKQPGLNEYLNCLKDVTQQLKEIVFFQRDLSGAENMTLSVHTSKTNSDKVLKAVIESARFFSSNQRVKIELLENNCNIDFVTDPALLCRVLVNMVKNAVEASPGKITIACMKKEKSVCFSVNNEALIPPEYQPYIFKPNFSTKDENRGLGTYSMRLIGENFLKGKVYFTTTRNNGTTFYIDLPINLK